MICAVSCDAGDPSERCRQQHDWLRIRKHGSESDTGWESIKFSCKKTICRTNKEGFCATQAAAFKCVRSYASGYRSRGTTTPQSHPGSDSDPARDQTGFSSLEDSQDIGQERFPKQIDKILSEISPCSRSPYINPDAKTTINPGRCLTSA